MSSTETGIPVRTTLLAIESSRDSRSLASASTDAPETTRSERCSTASPATTHEMSAAASSRARSATICRASAPLADWESRPVISAVAASQRSRRAASSWSRAFSMATPAAVASAVTIRSSWSEKSPSPTFSVR